jgi:hypothetical protein
MVWILRHLESLENTGKKEKGNIRDQKNTKDSITILMYKIMNLFFKVLTGVAVAGAVIMGLCSVDKKKEDNANEDYYRQRMSKRRREQEAAEAQERQADPDYMPDPDEEVYSTGPQQGGQGYGPGYRDPRYNNNNYGGGYRQQQPRREPQGNSGKAAENLRSMQEFFMRTSNFVNSLVIIVENLGRMFSSQTQPGYYSPTTIIA